jgi:MFS family permease
MLPNSREPRLIAQQPGRRARILVRLLAAIIAVTTIGGIILLELWAHPPAWLHEPRKIVVRTLHWIHENWLTSASLGVWVAIIGVVVPVILWWLDRRRRGRNLAEATSRRGDEGSTGRRWFLVVWLVLFAILVAVLQLIGWPRASHATYEWTQNFRTQNFGTQNFGNLPQLILLVGLALAIATVAIFLILRFSRRRSLKFRLRQAREEERRNAAPGLQDKLEPILAQVTDEVLNSGEVHAEILESHVNQMDLRSLLEVRQDEIWRAVADD